MEKWCRGKVIGVEKEIYSLKKKRILLFAPQFFDYEKYIKEEIERQGGIVHLYDERNNPTAVEKILLRKMRFLLERRINQYYQEVSESEKEFNPDYIVFINPESVNGESLKILRKTFPESCFILYMWDSSKNKKIKQYIDKFDYSFSFDKSDCEMFGMSFLPLFYIPAFEEMRQNDYDYDVSFIGTVHSDRPEIIYKLKEYCDNNNLSYFFYLYIPGKLMLLLRLITNKYLRKLNNGYIHLEALDKSTLSKITARTRCVLDINHPKQTGLTMRTLEMIGQKRKIMTTNEHVKEYDFYVPSNQIILHRNEINILPEYIRDEYRDIAEEIYNKYSLENWIKTLFGKK